MAKKIIILSLNTNYVREECKYMLNRSLVREAAKKSSSTRDPTAKWGGGGGGGGRQRPSQ